MMRPDAVTAGMLAMVAVGTRARADGTQVAAFVIRVHVAGDAGARRGARRRRPPGQLRRDNGSPGSPQACKRTAPHGMRTAAAT